MHSRLQNLERRILLINAGFKVQHLFRTIVKTNPAKWKLHLPGKKNGEEVTKVLKATKNNSFKDSRGRSLIVDKVLLPSGRKITETKKRKLISGFVKTKQKKL